MDNGVVMRGVEDSVFYFFGSALSSVWEEVFFYEGVYVGEVFEVGKDTEWDTCVSFFVIDNDVAFSWASAVEVVFKFRFKELR